MLFNKHIKFKNNFDGEITKGDGIYTKKCQQWLEQKFNIKKVLLTTSCTSALEMAAILCNIKGGDEVIMPSYTFVSTANAFVLRGAKIVFIDIRHDTMNMNEKLIEAAITKRTKAIVPVHYAGVACEMDEIMRIAKKYNLYVIEDAAQGVMSSYKGKPLGSIGDIGCFSFHESKNYSMGEGGAILINKHKLIKRAEIIREKGTNRTQFIEGKVDKYSWVDIGSSYLPSDILACYLYDQLKRANEINDNRLLLWDSYYQKLSPLAHEGLIDIPYIPKHCKHNAHMFYIKCKNITERDSLIKFLKKINVCAAFHYVPLHSSKYGRKVSSFHGKDIHTTSSSEKLLRLPMHSELSLNNINFIVKSIMEFYKK